MFQQGFSIVMSTFANGFLICTGPLAGRKLQVINNGIILLKGNLFYYCRSDSAIQLSDETWDVLLRTIFGIAQSLLTVQLLYIYLYIYTVTHYLPKHKLTFWVFFFKLSCWFFAIFINIDPINWNLFGEFFIFPYSPLCVRCTRPIPNQLWCALVSFGRKSTTVDASSMVYKPCNIALLFNAKMCWTVHFLNIWLDM